MKISIITVCYNSSATISDTIESVISQSYPDIEYVVVDGGSTDGTLEIIEQYRDDITHFISEPDEGIYDAMNKGISICSGDIISILNSDDFYDSPNVINKIALNFPVDCDLIFGDVVYVEKDNILHRVRHLGAARFKPWKLRFGWMPPHAATFLKASVYEEFGKYKLNYKIAADYEYFVRVLLVERAKYLYLPEIIVHMREGGVSTSGMQSTITISKEILRSCKENRVYTNRLFVWGRLPIKYFMQKLFRTSI